MKGLSLKIIVFFTLLMLLVTLGSFMVMRFFLNRVGSGDSSSGRIEYDRHYAFIYSGSDDELWDSIYAGAAAEGEASGAYVEYFGQGLTTRYTRNELIEIAANAGVDGIIIEGDSDESTSDVIAAATARSIPVVTVFSDCVDSDRICFVGFSSYTLGRQYGAEIARYYDARNTRICVVMDYSPSGSSQDLVASGIADEFTDRGIGDNCTIEGVYVDAETAFTAEEDIRDIFMGANLPDAIVALNSIYTRCLFQAAVDYNKVGDVYLYGFNDSSDILEAVDKGILEATISVDSRQMGVSAVDALTEYLDTGYVSAYIAQDTDVVREIPTEQEDTDE